MNQLFAVTLFLLAVSCTTRQESERQQKEALPSEVLIFTEPARNQNGGVSDLLPVGADTLIAVKHGGGLALTTDGGTHWQHLHDRESHLDFVFFKSLTIDEQGVLWGLDSWGGIHEVDYARLMLSTDFGKTWFKHEFDPQIFFPYSIYSQPSQRLQVVTYSGTVYQLQDQIGSAWRPVQHLPELDYTVNDTISDDFYFAKHQFKFLKQGQLLQRNQRGWQVVGVTTLVNELHDVCACNGRIYFTSQGSAYGDSPDYLLTANGPQQPADTLRLRKELDQAYLRCDGRGRLWLFNYRGIWQKIGSEFRKLY
ncbi:WD40/YVTN/BNR-like repeat-containing protein [Hymenobacter pini]|uniref:WD40/YVTN/BNR-like repeat-containing protein n=1 Tax=Hymenobacter pini TaxID=2880879 RepID=UPI001CF22725|nr:hypothetical protein [Hymenobacter pini]MCA8832651.1 hypothetical protein [Hymenobacter pini]